jgi:hypothetical protein
MNASPICLRLLWQVDPRLEPQFVREKVGNRIAAKIMLIPSTTRSSIEVEKKIWKIGCVSYTWS